MTSDQPRWTPETIAREAYRAAVQAIERQRTPAGIAAMRESAARIFDSVWADIRQQVELTGPRFACTSGCTWCCYQAVTVTPPAAVAIAEYVRAYFSAEALDALKARLAALDDRSRGLGAFARGCLKVPCAFLVDGRCSIYEIRPIRCRSVYSRDVGQCRWATENPDLVYAWRDRELETNPYPPEPHVIADSVLSGLATAARDAGLDFEALELTAALRIALDTPDIAERYLRGEPVFAGAAIAKTPEDGMVTKAPHSSHGT